MFGERFIRARPRAPFMRVGGVTVACGLILLGCATTASSRSTRSSASAYDHAPRPVPTSAPGAFDSVVDSKQSVLDRRGYVQAVLAQNPSIEAARQGWRAALARVEQTGSFE